MDSLDGIRQSPDSTNVQSSSLNMNPAIDILVSMGFINSGGIQMMCTKTIEMSISKMYFEFCQAGSSVDDLFIIDAYVRCLVSTMRSNSEDRPFSDIVQQTIEESQHVLKSMSQMQMRTLCLQLHKIIALRLETLLACCNLCNEERLVLAQWYGEIIEYLCSVLQCAVLLLEKQGGPSEIALFVQVAMQQTQLECSITRIEYTSALYTNAVDVLAYAYHMYTSCAITEPVKKRILLKALHFLQDRTQMSVQLFRNDCVSVTLPITSSIPWNLLHRDTYDDLNVLTTVGELLDVIGGEKMTLTHDDVSPLPTSCMVSSSSLDVDNIVISGSQSKYISLQDYIAQEWHWNGLSLWERLNSFSHPIQSVSSFNCCVYDTGRGVNQSCLAALSGIYTGYLLKYPEICSLLLTLQCSSDVFLTCLYAATPKLVLTSADLSSLNVDLLIVILFGCCNDALIDSICAYLAGNLDTITLKPAIIQFVSRLKLNGSEETFPKVLSFLVEYCHRRLFILTCTQVTETDATLLNIALQQHSVCTSFYRDMDRINVLLYSIQFPLIHPVVLADVCTACIEADPPQSDFISFQHVQTGVNNALRKSTVLQWTYALSSILSCFPLTLYHISLACKGIDSIHKLFKGLFPVNYKLLNVHYSGIDRSMVDQAVYNYAALVAQVPKPTPGQLYTVATPKQVSMLPLRLVHSDGQTNCYLDLVTVPAVHIPLFQLHMQEFACQSRRKFIHLQNVVIVIEHICRYLSLPIHTTYTLDIFRQLGGLVSTQKIKANVMHVPAVIAKTSSILMELYDLGVVNIAGHVLLEDLIVDIHDMRCLGKNISKRHRSSLIASVQQLQGVTEESVDLQCLFTQIGDVNNRNIVVDKMSCSTLNFHQIVSLLHAYIQSVQLPSSVVSSLSVVALYDLVLELFKHGRYCADKSSYLHLLLSLYQVTRMSQRGNKHNYIGYSQIHEYIQQSCGTSTSSSRYTVVVQSLDSVQRTQDQFIGDRRSDRAIWHEYQVKGVGAFAASAINESSRTYFSQLFTPQNEQWKNTNDVLGLQLCEEIGVMLASNSSSLLSVASQHLLIQVGLGDGFSLFEREPLCDSPVGNITIQSRLPIQLQSLYPIEWFLFMAAQSLRYDLTAGVHVEATKGLFVVFQTVAAKCTNRYLLSMGQATMLKMIQESLTKQITAIPFLESTIQSIDLRRLGLDGPVIQDEHIYQLHRLSVTYIYSLCVQKGGSESESRHDCYVINKNTSCLSPILLDNTPLMLSSLKLAQILLYCTADSAYRVQVARTALFEIVDILNTVIENKLLVDSRYTSVYTYYTLLVLSYSFEALLKLSCVGIPQNSQVKIINDSNEMSRLRDEDLNILSNTGMMSPTLDYLHSDMQLPRYQDRVDVQHMFTHLVWPKLEGRDKYSDRPSIDDHTTTVFLKQFNLCESATTMVQHLRTKHPEHALRQSNCQIYYSTFFFVSVVNTLCNTSFKTLESGAIGEHVLSDFSQIPELSPSKQQCNLLYRFQFVHGLLTSHLNVWKEEYVELCGTTEHIEGNTREIDFCSFYRAHTTPVCNPTCMCRLRFIIPQCVVQCDYIVVFLMMYSDLHTIRISNATLSYIHNRLDQDITHNSEHYTMIHPYLTKFNRPLTKSTKRKRHNKVVKHTGQGYLQQWRKEELGNMRGVVYDGYEELEQFIASDSDNDE